MSEYAPWELQGWRDLYEDRDADGEQVLAVYESDNGHRYICRIKGGRYISFDFDGENLIQKQPPRMYACQLSDGYVTTWDCNRDNAASYMSNNPGSRLISRPADADPMDFTQWRAE